MSLLFECAVGLLSFLGLVCASLALAPSFCADILNNALSAKPRVDNLIFVLIASGGWLAILYFGVYGLLWFIPETWGKYYEENWIPARQSFAGICAMWGTYLIMSKAKDLAWEYLEDEEIEKEKEDARRKRQENRR